MRISLSEDKPNTVVVYGEYSDGSEYVEIPTKDKVRIYTGKPQETVYPHFMLLLGLNQNMYLLYVYA